MTKQNNKQMTKQNKKIVFFFIRQKLTLCYN